MARLDRRHARARRRRRGRGQGLRRLQWQPGADQRGPRAPRPPRRTQPAHRAPARAGAAQRRRGAHDQSRSCRRAHRRRDAAGVHPQQLRVQTARQAGHGERDRRPARRRPPISPSAARSGRHRRNPAPRSNRAWSSCATCATASRRNWATRLFRAADGRLRHDHRRDGEAERRFHARAAPALPAAAHVGEVRAGEEIRPARAEAHPGALDQQPLGAGVAGPRRRGRPRAPISRAAPPSGSSRPPSSSAPASACAPLPATFWTKSDLYPVPAGDPRKKNTHASCWHIDLDTRHPLAAEHRAQHGVVPAPRTTSSATAITS